MSRSPSLTRAPVRHDRRGVRVLRVVLSAGGRPSTRSLSNRTPVLSWRSSAWVNEPSNAPLTRIIELTDLCATARACALVRLRSPRGGAPRQTKNLAGLGLRAPRRPHRLALRPQRAHPLELRRFWRQSLRRRVRSPALAYPIAKRLRASTRRPRRRHATFSMTLAGAERA